MKFPSSPPVPTWPLVGLSLVLGAASLSATGSSGSSGSPGKSGQSSGSGKPKPEGPPNPGQGNNGNNGNNGHWNCSHDDDDRPKPGCSHKCTEVDYKPCKNRNNGWGNGDQDAPGNSGDHNNAENGPGSAPGNGNGKPGNPGDCDKDEKTRQELAQIECKALDEKPTAGNDKPVSATKNQNTQSVAANSTPAAVPTGVVNSSSVTTQPVSAVARRVK